MRRGFEGVPRATLVALVGAALVRAAALVLIAEGITRLIVSGETEGAWLALAGAVLRAGGAWASGVAGRRAAAGVKLAHRRGLALAVVERDLDAGSVAVTASRGLDDLDSYFTAVVPATIAAAVLPVALGVRVLVADPLSALILVLTLPLVPLFMALIGMHSAERVRSAQDALARLADHVAELARGLPVLVGLGRTEAQARRLAGIQREHSARAGKVLRTAFLSALALELLATLSVAVVAVVLGIRLLSGDIGLFDALLVLLLAPDCFTALREVGAAHHVAEDGRAVLARVRELTSGAVRRLRREPAAAVRVRDLAVRLPGRETPLVAGVALDVAPGEVVAITGASGAGKSTVLAALAGVLPAGAEVSGTVSGADPAALAWVPQDPRTVADTVRGEVALYAGEAADAVDLLLAEVGLAGLADARCADLSPGERRRLAVARALARVDRGARVLLLDEPTAHLDPGMAVAVRGAILRRRGRAAILLVSHDEATLALADRSVALDAAPLAVAAEEPAPDPEPFAAPREVAAEPARLPLARVARLALGPAPWTWLGALALGVAATGFGLALTALSAWLIVRAAEQPAIMYLLVAIVGVRFFGLGRGVARYAERLATHRAVFRATDDLRLTLWRGIAARSAGSRDLLEGGRAVDYLVGTAGVVRDLLPRVVPPVLVAVVVVAGSVLTTALVAPEAAVLVAAGLGAGLVVAILGGFLAGRVDERRRFALGGRLLRGVAALGRAAADLRANGVAPRALGEIDRDAAALAAAERRAAAGAEAAPALAGLAAAVTSIAAGGLLAGAQAPVATVAVVVLLVLALGEPLAAAATAAQKLPALTAALGDVERLLARPAAPEGGPVTLRARVASLDLDGVAVTWPGAATPAVSGVDAHAGRGRWLVVSGPSGSGKSTLLTLLLGGLDASAGRVAVDGVPLGMLDRDDWRRRVAWCPQDAHVFDSTIRGNLAIAGEPGAIGEDAMRDVLHRVRLDRVLGERGLDARVGPGGRALSGGERQRLAVARALLADADVVLLDEPTAHLDAPTAAALLGDLREALADRVVVLVTHRGADLHPGDALLDLGARASLVPAPAG